MKVYHVSVHREGTWYCVQALEDRAVITQGRTLDEVVFNLRDAELLHGDKDVHIELILPPSLKIGPTGARKAGKRRAV